MLISIVSPENRWESLIEDCNLSFGRASELEEITVLPMAVIW